MPKGGFSKPTMAAVLDHYGIAYRADTAGWVSALCPFHAEGVPSLRINIDCGGFLCQACGAKGGDSIAFIMAKEQCDFVTALAIGDEIPGERIDSRPTEIAGRPAPVGRMSFKFSYKRKRGRR